jgi:hypothetical protein
MMFSTSKSHIEFAVRSDDHVIFTYVGITKEKYDVYVDMRRKVGNGLIIQAVGSENMKKILRDLSHFTVKDFKAFPNLRTKKEKESLYSCRKRLTSYIRGTLNIARGLQKTDVQNISNPTTTITPQPAPTQISTPNTELFLVPTQLQQQDQHYEQQQQPERSEDPTYVNTMHDLITFNSCSRLPVAVLSQHMLIDDTIIEPPTPCTAMVENVGNEFLKLNTKDDF